MSALPDKEVASLLASAIQGQDFSEARIDAEDRSLVHLTVRPRYSSRVFELTLRVLDAKEV